MRLRIDSTGSEKSLIGIKCQRPHLVLLFGERCDFLAAFEIESFHGFRDTGHDCVYRKRLFVFAECQCSNLTGERSAANLGLELPALLQMAYRARACLTCQTSM